MKGLWSDFKKLPGVLQKQIIQRIGLGSLMLALSIIIWIAANNFALALPGLALMGYLGISGGLLLHNGINGKYICVSGTVKQIEFSGLRKRPKWLLLDVEGRTVQCPAHPQSKNFMAGNHIALYLAPSTPIYEQDGIYRIFDYLAMEQIQEKH